MRTYQYDIEPEVEYPEQPAPFGDALLFPLSYEACNLPDGNATQSNLFIEEYDHGTKTAATEQI